MKLIKKSVCAVLCCVMLMSFAVVGTVGANAAAPKLNKTKLTLTVGKNYTLKLKNAVSYKVKWTSSKTAVASVYSSGKVYANKKGSAVITAKYNGKSYKCKVTVKPKVSKFGKTFKVYKNDTYKLTIVNSYGISYNAKKWVSSNKKVATIDKNGLVKGKKVGTTIITATDSSDNLIRGTVKVVDGFKALKNYITKKGKTGDDGYKYISYEGSNYTCNITYDSDKKDFHFSGLYESGSNSESMDMVQHYGSSKAVIYSRIIYPNLNLDVTLQTAEFSTKKYNNDENAEFEAISGADDNLSKAVAESNVIRRTWFKAWTNMLRTNLTMGMAGVNFSKYPLC